MRILSWNMLFSNARLDDALAFIRDSDADVICLQEVPERLLEPLRSLPYHLAQEIDVRRATPRTETVYLAILSRFPILAQESFGFPDYFPLLPLRTRAFVRLMRIFDWTRIADRHAFSVDIDVAGTTMRVFNLHLILARPSWRLEEFERAMTERDPRLPTIVCGDFNVLESRRIAILNWLTSGTPGDVFFWRRERTRMETAFTAHELTNPLFGRVTHPLSHSQLDHILCSKHFPVKSAEVSRDRHGSDHCPIIVELDPHT